MKKSDAIQLYANLICWTNLKDIVDNLGSKFRFLKTHK